MKFVQTNSLMWNIFRFCLNSKTISHSKCISPNLITELLKQLPACYKNLKPHQKLELLSYCMKVQQYSDLNMLELLPLADDTFVQCDKGSTKKVYLFSPRFPISLLPFLENSLLLRTVTWKNVRKWWRRYGAVPFTSMRYVHQS